MIRWSYHMNIQTYKEADQMNHVIKQDYTSNENYHKLQKKLKTTHELFRMYQPNYIINTLYDLDKIINLYH